MSRRKDDTQRTEDERDELERSLDAEFGDTANRYQTGFEQMQKRRLDVLEKALL